MKCDGYSFPELSDGQIMQFHCKKRRSLFRSKTTEDEEQHAIEKVKLSKCIYLVFN